MDQNGNEMHAAKQQNKKRISLPIPAWLYLMVTILLYELVLHFWVTETIHTGRLLAIIAFALGLGGALGLVVSFLPAPGGQKWAAVALTVVLAVLYLVEYFLYDAYKTFMSIESVINGAGGVANGFLDTVLNLLALNLWRILVVLLPPALYAILGAPKKPRWAIRGAVAGATAALYVLAIAAVYGLTNDASQFGPTGSFDASLPAFGMNVAIGLDLVRTSGAGQEMVYEPVPTLATEPVEETKPVATQPVENPEETESTEPAETEPIVYEPNVLPLDFAALAETETNKDHAAIHSYLASRTPTLKNEYTGLFEGKNLIFLSAESFSKHIIDPELTPTLYRLSTEGINFTDYYQPIWGGSTTTGEFTNLVGMFPADGVGCMKEAVDQDLFFTMGSQLMDRGYYSMAYHNNDYRYYDRHLTHTGLGYEQYIGYGNGMEEGVTAGWPQSDLEMVEFTLEQYIDKQPFNIYYMTVSGHCGYTRGNDMTEKHWDKVKDLDYPESIKCYIGCNLELEAALQYLVEQLEAAGIADDTVIVVGPDHYPYALQPSDTWSSGWDSLSQLYGEKVGGNEFVRDANMLIIWSGCLEDMDIVIDEPVYSLDILPTLSNLFGVEFDSRMMVGRDVFSEQEPLVFWPSGSWITDKGSYWAYSNQFTPKEGVTVEEGYVEYISAIVRNHITYSRQSQWKNYFNVLSALLYPETEEAAE